MNQIVRVMKAGQAPNPDEAIGYNFEDLREKCERYLEQIRQQARGILTEAQQQAEQERAEAQKNGYQSGRQQGLEKAEEEIEQRSRQKAEQMVAERLGPLQQSLDQGLELLERERTECLARWEGQLVHLSLAVAEKTIRAKLPEYPETIVTIIQEMMQLVIGQTNLKLYLNDEDHRRLGESFDRLQATLNRTAQAEILTHPDLKPGDCLLETSQGSLDGRIETQLARISEELLDDHSRP